MTTTATLTERYISATIRSLTPEVQDDVRAEPVSYTHLTLPTKA